jgi:thiamine-phosphate pyrophosphorylase
VKPGIWDLRFGICDLRLGFAICRLGFGIWDLGFGIWDLGFPRLQAIVDVDTAQQVGWAANDLARAYLDGGARFLQIRAKQLSSGPLLDLCDAIVASARRYDAQVIVNDRVDLAALANAAGVHVGQDDLPPTAVRAQLGQAAIVGYSTHNVEQIDAALREPVSYLAVGPVFGTRTKETGYDAVGLDLVRAAAARAGGTPIVAIGGITLETAPAVIEAGAATVAVISDLLADGDPRGRVRRYIEALGR